jgi:hypothetical protein
VKTNEKIIAVALGLLIPGGGQLYKRDYFKAFMFMGAVGVSFFMGVMLIDKTSENSGTLVGWWLNLVSGRIMQMGTIGVMLAMAVKIVLAIYPVGPGLVFFALGVLVNWAGFSFNLGGAMIRDISFTYLVVAGLMNILALLDATKDRAGGGEGAA